jgi:hypothetical protein
MADNGSAGEAVWSVDRFRAFASAPKVVRLPRSGGVVRVHELGAADLAAQGMIPEALTEHVFHDLVDLERQRIGPEERRRVGLERTDAINAVVAAFVVEPRFTTAAEHDADVLPVTLLPWEDRVHLFRVALGTADPEGGLARFPDEQAGGLSPAQDGAGLQHEAELSPGAAGE